nr:Retrovirus-related Pol polyprotein from transposon TNT 1-94 [Ipomoea batatas]
MTENFVQPTIPRFDDHYDYWSMLMENFLRSKELWEDTSKDIWDSLKKKCHGNTKTKRLQLQNFRSEFETLQMKEGENFTEFYSRTMAIVNKLRIHGDKVEDSVVNEKILRSMTTKYNFVVCATEEGNDLNLLTLDELESSILVHERKLNRHGNEAEQALKVVSTQNQSSTTNGGNRGRGHGRGRGNRGRGRGGHHSSKSVDKSNIECYRCHKYGHYKSECRTNLNKQKEESTNFVEK